MPTSFLEIVELKDGDIALRSAEDNSEPLVRIRFSEESRHYMMGNALEVAKVMIQAGIAAAAAIAEQSEQETQAGHQGVEQVLH